MQDPSQTENNLNNNNNNKIRELIFRIYSLYTLSFKRPDIVYLFHIYNEHFRRLLPHLELGLENTFGNLIRDLVVKKSDKIKHQSNTYNTFCC